ncbi:MAG: hypothetical protein BWX88_00888 [Planctomycetes bacterium ADurb.Bin126]|nr:MAG: hypothetical protein BWX88_00888 [Planctomycetes bacterium ADurb.Bin126]HOD83391.1 hypothetical protein [Phycisphaerae bacterium]HQL74193.1 hypothetical protein [Phycisphaerae bacterium]
MPTFDLYGFAETDLSAVSQAVEGVLGVEFARRDNPHMGGEFFATRPGPGNEHFVLRRNHDPGTDGPAEGDFAKYPTLLYVNCTGRSEEVRARLQSLDGPPEHLRQGPLRR